MADRSGTLLAAVVAGAAALAAPAARADEVLIFAAASLKNALDAVTARWSERTGSAAVVSYAATSALARQIEQGAPAGVFFSADLDWMDYLEARGLIDPATRTDLLGNRLVLIASGGAPPPVPIAPGFDLAGALGDGRLAIADVEAVPAGRYAKAALESLGAWDSVEGRLAQAENVRAALAFVARGEAPLGIVYATDARAEPSVTVVGAFPEHSHPPIVYPVAGVAGSTDADTQAFLDYLASPEAGALFAAEGFRVLD